MLYLLYIITAIFMFKYYKDETRSFFERNFCLYAGIGCVVELICRMIDKY